jgi:hypothetical protein
MNYIVSEHPVLKGQKCIYTVTDIKTDTVLFSLKELPILNTNNQYAITKIRNKEYYDTTNYAIKYINHSCEPTVVIDLINECIKTKRDVRKGEMITFDYLTTEYDMAVPFNCVCGSQKCHGRINGVNTVSNM